MYRGVDKIFCPLVDIFMGLGGWKHFTQGMLIIVYFLQSMPSLAWKCTTQCCEIVRRDFG